MSKLNRREFLLTSAATAYARGESGKPRVGMVQSTHGKLIKPASLEDPLDYEKVRDMVWKAIEYGKARAGSLEKKIKPGSWVVIKPNIVFLRPQPSYRTGDVTDLRVTRAVLEYVAQKSKARRITIAEGGSYRNLQDPQKDNRVTQNGSHASAPEFDWGADEFPGTGGSYGALLKEFAQQFPGKQFDFVDLSYDAIKDSSGKPMRIPVAKTAKGVGAFSERPDYFYSKTVKDCDFLIAVPVAKIHAQCGITACFKSYVGVAPREAYARPGIFWNASLHQEHSVDNRIDTFISDLSSFHPPDYNVVDFIRGLQYSEHNTNQPDQMIKSNMVLASEDTVATDALVAHLMGFNPRDIDYLHMGQARDLGTLDLDQVNVVGDDPSTARKRWGKPRNWYGRGNREWRVAKNPSGAPETWARYTSPSDALNFAKWSQGETATGMTYAAATKVRADGNKKAYLWVGLRGKVTATLNGETVMQEENYTRYRVGQFQKPIELKPGENTLVFKVEALNNQAVLSALMVGQRNDGDTLDGIRWLA